MDMKQKTNVETLLDKAAMAASAPEAINFAQAACNAANALRVLAEIEQFDKSTQN
jgi:hypothetical protein